MDIASLDQYIGKQIILTLRNGYWYKATILNVTSEVVTFIELKGRTISVVPD